MVAPLTLDRFLLFGVFLLRLSSFRSPSMLSSWIHWSDHFRAYIPLASPDPETYCFRLLASLSYLSLFLLEFVYGPAGDVSQLSPSCPSCLSSTSRSFPRPHLGQRPKANAQNLMISRATCAATGPSISFSDPSIGSISPSMVDPSRSSLSIEPRNPRSVRGRPPLPGTNPEPRDGHECGGG